MFQRPKVKAKNVLLAEECERTHLSSRQGQQVKEGSNATHYIKAIKQQPITSVNSTAASLSSASCVLYVFSGLTLPNFPFTSFFSGTIIFSIELTSISFKAVGGRVSESSFFCYSLLVFTYSYGIQ